MGLAQQQDILIFFNVRPASISLATTRDRTGSRRRLTMKCPKCDRSLVHLKLATPEIRDRTTKWLGVAYLCPYCNSILGAGIDPVALKTDTVQEVLKALRKES